MGFTTRETELQSFDVKGMTCGHCVRAVTEAIGQIDPGARVEVDLDAGRVRVSGETAPAADLVRAIQSEGYEAKPAGV